jgi:uncharacterized membrane protein
MPKAFGDPETILKILAALSYPTGGMVAFIYVLANGKGNQNYFFRFHFFQSLLLGIFAMLLSYSAGALGSIFTGIATGIASLTGGGPIVSNIVSSGFGIIAFVAQIVFAIAALVGVVQSLRGKYVDIPLVGKIARQNLR